MKIYELSPRSKWLTLFLLPIFIGSNIGCWDGNGLEKTSSFHNQLDEADEPWKLVDESRLPKHPAPRSDPLELVFPKNAGISFEEFVEWVRIDDTGEEPTKITQIEKRRLLRAKSFDCTPFVWDNEIKVAIQSAKDLKWLRIGRTVSEADIEWISQMRGLRGLDFNYSDLRKIDLGTLGSLRELQWLGCSGSQMPLIAESRLPVLPNLEVLGVGGRIESDTNADDHFPYDITFPKLKVLYATWTDIDDQQFASFVRRHRGLRSLSINNASQLTERSAVEIAKLPELKYLHIGGTIIESALYDADYGGVPYLQSKLPDCFIGLGD